MTMLDFMLRVQANTMCLMSEWTAQEKDEMKGLYITSTRSPEQVVGHLIT